MSKKVCFLISNMNNTGGTERVCSIVANNLDKAGYQILITSISQGNQPSFALNKNIKTTSLFSEAGKALYRSPAIVYKLRRLLIKNRIDILIVVETMSVLFTLPAIKGLSVKHICWEHFNFKNDNGKVGRRVARHLAARYCDFVVTLTERDKNYWLAKTNHKDNIVVIPNPNPFKPKVVSLENTDKIVLATGRLTYVKGFDLLIESWNKVTQQFPDWKLVIVGEGEEGTNLRNIIKRNNLVGKVILAGYSNDISQYYEKASIFCLSSRYEGFPMVLLEALAFGLPIVSFDCDTGPAEILEGTRSILVPQKDTKALGDSLIQLMGNQKLREKISLTNIQKSEYYEPNFIILRWIEIIDSLNY